MIADLELKYTNPNKRRKAIENGEGAQKKGKGAKKGKTEETSPMPKRTTRSSKK